MSDYCKNLGPVDMLQFGMRFRVVYYSAAFIVPKIELNTEAKAYTENISKLGSLQ